ncbi:MAG: dependent oxidoreductase family protein [Betaproteobacteria bacterium]|nr:dependent oxidoreductase family protein [Betaproteobacteria bacterium]
MTKKITIIGAGIVGVATASYLKRDGQDVTVVDMRPPGEYCSFGNAGILSPGSCVPLATPGIHWKVPGYLADPMGPLTIRWGYLPKAAPWLLRFLAASNPKRVEGIADALRPLLRQTFDAYEPLVQHAGVTDLIRRTGYVVTYEKRASYVGDSLAWKLRRDRGVIVEELVDAGIKALVPQLTGHYEVGLYLPEQGFVANPERLTKALAAQFQRDGGVVLQRKVLDIEVGPDGPRALITSEGRMPVETLVICAGSHSNEFTSKLGDRVPLEAERGYHVTYSDPGYTLPMPVFMPEHKFFITPMEMGLRIAGQTEFAGIDAEPNYARADILDKHMRRVFPKISPADATKWMGRRPSMPDSLPVIGRATRFANVYYAFGHGHVGLCSGAPTGRIVADLVAGRQPNVDVTPYRPDRF